ncbi:MAG: glycosyltransferase [Pirellulales bacterium]
MSDGHSSPDDAAYFNAGVMLIDLAAWREKRIMDNSLAYLSEHGDKAEFLHQEALNAVAWDDWVPLEERWNLPMTAGRWFAQTPAAALSDPAIIHYSGRIKPWCTTHGGRFFDAYSGALEYVRERHDVSLFETFDRSQMLGLYDRSLRSVIYPLEKFLWNRGQI